MLNTCCVRNFAQPIRWCPGTWMTLRRWLVGISENESIYLRMIHAYTRPTCVWACSSCRKLYPLWYLGFYYFDISFYNIFVVYLGVCSWRLKLISRKSNKGIFRKMQHRTIKKNCINYFKTINTRILNKQFKKLVENILNNNTVNAFSKEM